MMDKKWCSCCFLEKPLSEFHRRSRSKDGLQPWCKECVKQNNAKRRSTSTARTVNKTHSVHKLCTAKKERDAQYSRNYRKNHPDSCNKNSRRYRERKVAAGGDYSAMDAARCLAFFDYQCAYTGLPLGDDYQFDHVVPVSKGGVSSIRNLVPCLPTINLSKASNELDSWYTKQTFYTEERHKRIKEWCAL